MSNVVRRDSLANPGGRNQVLANPAGRNQVLQAPAARPGPLKFATAGSVDDGKSTLIGRLLLDAKLILSDQLDALHAAARDGRPDLASITDGLRAEREQGITIDVAYRYFATLRRSFVVADTPGHERYTRNMVTGASTAQLAVILVDARRGVLEQSRRHLYLSHLLGISELVVAVNKMDLVGWEEARFRAIEAELAGLAASIGAPTPVAIPLSALEGDNVVARSPHTPWHGGPALLEHLESVEIAERATHGGFRMPVQWVIRPRDGDDTGRRYAGTIAGGSVAAGDPLVVLPSGVRTSVLEVATADGPLIRATTADAVSLRLADDLDVGRGDTLAAPDSAPAVGRSVEATVCWMAEAPLRPDARLLLKAGTQTLGVRVTVLRSQLELDALAHGPAPAELALNAIGRVHLETDAPLVGDGYAENRATGAFVLIDARTNETVGAGMVEQISALAQPQRSPDVTWQPSELDRVHRTQSLGHAGATLWLTGLPASGKSTIAAALEARLVAEGRPAYRLDGDNLRHGLCGDLGFSPADRTENIRRVAHVARLMADAGQVAIVSLVSPTAADRDLARALHAAAGLPFAEVWVDTPLERCEARDPKGLYARARRGELVGLTGVDGPYEPPRAPELILDGATESAQASAARLVQWLQVSGSG